MRLLLDDHLSPKRIGRPLRGRGHDVRAVAEEEAPAGLPDVDVLALAADEARILITCDARHFVPLAREWAGRERSHAGIVLVRSLTNDRYAAIVKALDALFELYPQQKDWTDLVVAV